MVTPAPATTLPVDSTHVPRFGKNGSALTQEERANIARRRGLCVGCGIKTHSVSVFKKVPLTNESVYKGICIPCHAGDTSIPPSVLQEYEDRNPRIHAPIVMDPIILEGRQGRRTHELIAQRRKNPPPPPSRPPKAAFPDRRKSSLTPEKIAETMRAQDMIVGPSVDDIASETKPQRRRASMPGAVATAPGAPPSLPFSIDAHGSQRSSAASTVTNSTTNSTTTPPRLSSTFPGSTEETTIPAQEQRRPVTIQVDHSSLSTANGVYHLGHYATTVPRYTKNGFLDGGSVIFLLHRSSNRWFLSAVLPNGGRVYLYCAPYDGQGYAPPVKGWERLTGVKGTSSLTLTILKWVDVKQELIATAMGVPHHTIHSLGHVDPHNVDSQATRKCGNLNVHSGEDPHRPSCHRESSLRLEQALRRTSTISNNEESFASEEFHEHAHQGRRYSGIPKELHAYLHNSAPAALQKRFSGLPKELHAMDDSITSSPRASAPQKSARDVVWDPENSGNISLEDYAPVPDMVHHEGDFPWMQQQQKKNEKVTAATGPLVEEKKVHAATAPLAEQTVLIKVITSTMLEFLIPMKVTCETTIHRLKEEIQKRKGIPVEQQELTLGSGKKQWPTLLADDKLLYRYKLWGHNHNHVDLHFPPGYPCRRLLIDFFGEAEQVDVDPCDTVERVNEIIRTSPWFVDQLRYMPPDEAERIALQLSLEGQQLDATVKLAELNIPHDTTFQLEVVADQGEPEETEMADKLACARAYQEETFTAIMNPEAMEAEVKTELPKPTFSNAEEKEKEKKEQEKMAELSKFDPEFAANISRARIYQERLRDKLARAGSIKEEVANEEPTASHTNEKTENTAPLQPMDNDLAAKLARCRAWQQEVLQNIEISSSTAGCAEKKSTTPTANSKESKEKEVSDPKIQEPETHPVAASGNYDTASAEKSLGELESFCPPSGMGESEYAPNNQCDHTDTVKDMRTTTGSPSTFDPTKILAEAEEMRLKFEQLEKTQEQAFRKASIGDPMATDLPLRAAREDEANTDPNETPIGILDQPMRSKWDEPKPSLTKNDHSQRIRRLEAKVEAYEEQLDSLLHIMESTYQGVADDTLAQRRVELAHKILRGENDAVLERAVFGFQMDEGDFQPDKQDRNQHGVVSRAIG